VVVVIIGILVAIAVPIYQNVQQNARDNADAANIRTINGAIAMYMAANTDPPTEGAGGNLVPTHLQEWPEPPNGLAGTYVIDEIASGQYVAIRQE